MQFGDDPPPSEPATERRRRQWREAGARRRARVRAAEGLGLLYPDDTPRGLGDNPGSGKRSVQEEGRLRMTLLIGEQPSAGGDPATPLEGAIGKRLAEYAGLTLDEYLTRTERRNLIEYASATWPASQASLNAGMLWSSLIGRRTIMLGQRVAKSFGIQWQPLRWVTVDDRGTQVAILPHPSGKNLWWNEPENRAAARRFLTETFR